MGDESNNKKLLELEKEFRDTVVTELKAIKSGQQTVEEGMKSLDKKVDLHIQKTEYELQNINALDAHQNQLIDEHIAGVQTLKKMHSDQTKYFEDQITIQHDHFNSRLVPLEAPSKALSLIKKWVVAIGAIAGALYAIGRIAGWF